MSSRKTGQVIWGNRNIFSVALESQGRFSSTSPIVECLIKGKRGEQAPLESEFVHEYNNYLVSGDKVSVDSNNMIVDRLERKNFIARIKQGLLYVMASNFDLVVLVTSLKDPQPRLEFLDRVMAAAQAQGIPLLLCINKCDLLASKSTLIEFQKYESLVDALYMISCKTGLGIQKLKKILTKKRLCVIGQSGVGKSTLVNTLFSQAQQKTGEISQKYQRGRHITIGARIIYTDTGFICDTPGVKDFVPFVWDTATLKSCFVEFDAYQEQCRIPNCAHLSEPHCAVRNEVGKKIDRKRYNSYTRILFDLKNEQKKSWYHKKPKTS